MAGVLEPPSQALLNSAGSTQRRELSCCPDGKQLANSRDLSMTVVFSLITNCACLKSTFDIAEGAHNTQCSFSLTR